MEDELTLSSTTGRLIGCRLERCVSAVDLNMKIQQYEVNVKV